MTNRQVTLRADHQDRLDQILAQALALDYVHAVDIGWRDLENEFVQCETKVERIEGQGVWAGFSYWRQLVLYRGRWRYVGQTDLYDNVGTGWCDPDAETAGARLQQMILFAWGARVSDEHVSFITHLSDG